MSDKKQLIILPFDHRDSFMKKMFGILDRPTPEETERISFFKEIVYRGFVKAIENSDISFDNAGILVDEQFGDKIIKEAKERGFIVCICSEKSGQEEFDFEYGEDFSSHIDKYSPDFVKALVRYNPDGDQDLNDRQAQKLKLLSDFCKNKGYKLMLEPLVIATPRQLELVDGDLNAYDKEMRPNLMELMIEELQSAGVEPDIWKIEGLEEEEDYKIIVDQAKSGGRDSNIIVLGRNAEDEQVEKWLKSGARVKGVVGFAVGRTVFWDPLIKYKENKISSDEASELIAERFIHFYDIFDNNRIK